MARMAPHQVVLHGHELSYVDSGSGPAVLFIHGILGSQRQWAHLVDKMDDDHRVLVPDLFGHGESAKPLGDYSLSAHAATMRDLLDRLGIERVTLVGHSLGGGIAMQFFYLFPERVDRLVLVAERRPGARGEPPAALRDPARRRAGARHRRLRPRPVPGRGPGARGVPGRVATGRGPRRDLAGVHARSGTGRAGAPSWPPPAP